MTYRQSSDQMILIAFMQAQNCTQYPGSWRHPESSLDFMSPGFYADLARKLEAAKFHMAFFDDRLAIPDIYKHDHSMTIEYGIRAVKMDPVICAQVMGMATQKLGIGALRGDHGTFVRDVADAFDETAVGACGVAQGQHGAAPPEVRTALAHLPAFIVGAPGFKGPLHFVPGAVVCHVL